MWLTAIALLIWVLSCFAIYWMFTTLLEVPATAPFVAIANAKNFERAGDRNLSTTVRRSGKVPMLVLVFGFGLSGILVLAAIVAFERGGQLRSALLAAGSASLLAISTRRLKGLAQHDK